MSALLDTHVVLWWLAGGERLSGPARTAISAAAQLFVSAISFWEVATLERRGRIVLDRPVRRWVADLLVDPRVELAPLAAETAIWAGSELGDEFPGDPADRLIYATARSLHVPLVSKDERVRGFAAQDDVRVIW
ncbi:MAG TPA: type II toxin-antitoxin system VapC family toxin [Candidatus Limnocylindrales bacterium]|nr:type II toxin-antitoxin system VapC family toxin [Candidatus Limnocylindrales bacterium]